MQTFLPYPDFAASARVLDNRRLGKQRVETIQLLNALTDQTKGWKNHPAAKMWARHIPALVAYGAYICEEWKRRGYRDTCDEKIRAFAEPSLASQPWWIGDPSFHASHRSNLLRKDPKHYGQFGWTESPDLPYIWPSA